MFTFLKRITSTGIDKNKMSKLLHNVDVPMNQATFSLACFWSPDCLFGVTKGVIKTRVGYAGGTKQNPTYRNLGDHTESILIDYDPNVISYKELLNIFWNSHDPTAHMKQQYTSLIFYHNEDQKELAEESYKEQQQKCEDKLVTKILAASIFYDAEDYHQKYRLRQHNWLCEAVCLKTGDDFKNSYLAARLNGYVYGQGGINQFDEELEKLGLTDNKVIDYIRALIIKYEGQGLTC